MSPSNRPTRLFLLLSCAGLLVLPTLGGGRLTAAPAAPAITDEAIRKHITFLASDELKGRLPGTPGAEKAARYIADAFKHAGLTPLGDHGWYQEFPFIAKVKLGAKNRFAWTRDGHATTARVDEDFRPLGFTAPTPVAGDVVFAGFGISAADDAQYDDYAGLDVKDKIVVVLPYSPAGSNPHTKFGKYLTLRYKALTARTKGAKALVVIAEDDNFKDSQIARLRYDDAAGDAGLPCLAVSRKTANALFAGKAVAELEQGIAAAGKPNSFALTGLTVSLEGDVVKETQTGRNVVGLLEGSDPTLRNEIVVVGAHYDHLGLGGPGSLAEKEGQIHNGADDNASGTAGVIELARAFTANKVRPKRTILFIAFSAEEKGLIGSAFYVEHVPQKPRTIVAMLNMDMVGRLREDKLTVQGVGTSPDWRPIIERANADAKFALTLGEDGYGPSDHSSFYKKQIPVLFFFTGNHPDYHRPTDDVEKINFPGEHRVLDFVYRIAGDVANQAAKPAYVKAKSEDPATRASGGFRVYLGTIPDYNAQVQGVRLDGVRENSPAAKAGMKAGDVLIGLNGREIKNVYDYTYVLQELKPDQEIEVVVLRGTEKVVLKMVTGKR